MISLEDPRVQTDRAGQQYLTFRLRIVGRLAVDGCRFQYGRLRGPSVKIGTGWRELVSFDATVVKAAHEAAQRQQWCDTWPAVQWPQHLTKRP